MAEEPVNVSPTRRNQYKVKSQFYSVTIWHYKNAHIVYV